MSVSQSRCSVIACQSSLGVCAHPAFVSLTLAYHLHSVKRDDNKTEAQSDPDPILH